MSWLDALVEQARLIVALWETVRAGEWKGSAVNDDDYLPEERWWDPETRQSSPDEEALVCVHCERPLGPSTVKICPGCGVVLHAECYEDTEGGNAFATEGCDACRHRTYWR